MIPNMPNTFINSFLPGSQPLQVTSVLRDYRKNTLDMHVDELAEKTGLSAARILDLESGRTENPMYNVVATVIDGLDLCFAVDLSINTLRRQTGDIHFEDSPMALYGDTENPMEYVSSLLNKALNDRFMPLSKTELAEKANINYTTLNRLMSAQNVRLEFVLDILSDFDFALSIESKAYHKKWDEIGKDRKIVENEHNVNLLKTYLDRNGSQLKSNRLFDPAIKNTDGNHLLFKKLTKDRRSAAELGFNPFNGFKISP